MNAVFAGGCLCGSVRYESASEPAVAGHCHCVDCRKTSGTGHASHIGLPDTALTVTGEVKFFDAPADSGNVVSRGFCPNCGSAIYSTNSGMPGMAFIRASSLDDSEVFQPQLVVYTKRAASWDRVDPALPSFEGMPPPADMPADMKP